jgi:hypothetical protein
MSPANSYQQDYTGLQYGSPRQGHRAPAGDHRVAPLWRGIMGYVPCAGAAQTAILSQLESAPDEVGVD